MGPFGVHTKRHRPMAGERQSLSLARECAKPWAQVHVCHPVRMGPTMNSRRLSLVIPAYNEALSIRQAIEEAETALPHVASDFEILVVDDGSRDDTCRVVRDSAAQA